YTKALSYRSTPVDCVRRLGMRYGQALAIEVGLCHARTLERKIGCPGQVLVDRQNRFTKLEAGVGRTAIADDCYLWAHADLPQRVGTSIAVSHRSRHGSITAHCSRRNRTTPIRLASDPDHDHASKNKESRRDGTRDENDVIAAR